MRFEWDSGKAISNLRKHGIDFADAVTVLEDDRAVRIREETVEDARFVTIGMDTLARVLVVVYAWRDEKIRIISARKATRNERRRYEGKL